MLLITNIHNANKLVTFFNHNRPIRGNYYDGITITLILKFCCWGEYSFNFVHFRTSFFQPTVIAVLLSFTLVCYVVAIVMYNHIRMYVLYNILNYFDTFITFKYHICTNLVWGKYWQKIYLGDGRKIFDQSQSKIKWYALIIINVVLEVPKKFSAWSNQLKEVLNQAFTHVLLSM